MIELKRRFLRTQKSCKLNSNRKLLVLNHRKIPNILLERWIEQIEIIYKCHYGR